MTLSEWATRWNVSQQAINELISMRLPTSIRSKQTEGAVQQDIRLEASRIGSNLWRNNNGVAIDANGRHIRYGLGNDSQRINEVFKSSDLIGPTPIIDPISGFKYGVFTAIEVKPGNWSWSNTDREQAQWKFLQLVISKGGFATFARSTQDYKTCLVTHVLG